MPVSLCEWRVRIGTFICRRSKEYDYNNFLRRLDNLMKRTNKAKSPKENNSSEYNISSPAGSSNVSHKFAGNTDRHTASSREVNLITAQTRPSHDINNSRGNVNSPGYKDASHYESLCAEKSGSPMAKETSPVPEYTDVQNQVIKPCEEDELDNRYITIHQSSISNKKSSEHPAKSTQESKTERSDVGIIEANNNSPAVIVDGPVLGLESIRPHKEDTSNCAPSGLEDQSSGLSPKPRQDTTRNTEETTSITKAQKFHGSQTYPVLGSGITSGQADAIKDIACPAMTNTLLLRSGDVELNPGPNDTLPSIDEQREDEGQTEIDVKEAIMKGMAPWNRSRIMVIGPAGVGKTSLIRRLTGQRFNPDEKSTKGAEQNVVTQSAVSSWILVNDANRAKGDLIQSIATMDPNFGSNRSCSTGGQEKQSDPGITETKTVESPHIAESDIGHDEELLESKRIQSRGTNRSTLGKGNMSKATKYESSLTVLPTIDNEKIAKISQGITREEITKVKSSALDVTYSMWDFGGQDIYRITHPLFLSWRSLYILVIPLHLRLSDEAPREEEVQDSLNQLKEPDVKTHRNIRDLVHFWLMSVYTHAVRDSNHEPKVLLIGTFAGDEGPEIIEEKVKVKFLEMKDQLGSNPYWKLVLSPMCGIDNHFSPRSAVDKIQERIGGLVKDSAYMKVLIPIKWRTFVIEIENSDKETLTVSEARRTMKTLGIIGDGEVEAALKFYHDIGHLIYHPGCELIVLRPQFLNSIVNNIITVSDDKKKMASLGFVSKRRKYKRMRLNTDGQRTTEVVDAPIPKRLRKTPDTVPPSVDLPEEIDVVEPVLVTDQIRNDGTFHEGHVRDCNSFWETIKDDLITTYFAISGSPEPGQICTMCKRDQASVTCDDCDLADPMCINCAVITHKSKFHKPKEWVNGLPEELLLTVVCRRVHHQCTDVYTKNLDVYDDKGRHHNAAVRFCTCESEASTLLRYRLWASSKNPRRAVHLELLNLIHYSIMENKTSLHSLCQMLRWKNGLSSSQASALYRELVGGTLEHWEDFHQTVLQRAIPHSDNGSTCPACPKKDGTVIIAIDGNFGLVRRRKAGTSDKLPKAGFFLPDEDVRSFTEAYNDKLQHNKECSQFQAGHLLRSKKKNAALDVKGVFAAVCKHGFPLAAMNMFHGERLGYPVRLITHLLDKLTGPDVTTDIHVIYDIGCMLHKHLQNTGQADLLSKTHLSVPAFHVYGHKPSCQITYGVRNQENVGLCDGEGVERLWSFLRQFASMTKEMAPSKRVDTLNRALIHFSMRKQEMLGQLLCNNMTNAQRTLTKCEEQIEQICTDYSVTEEHIDTWSRTMATELQKLPATKRKSETVHETYVQLLTQHFELGQASEDDSQRARIQRSTKTLDNFERKHHITRRWAEADALYQSTKSASAKRKQAEALEILRSSVAERSYVKELLKKYSVGQAIAIRLSKEMKARTKAMNTALNAYNAIASRMLEFEEAANPEAAVYSSIASTAQTDMRVPHGVRYEAVTVLVKRKRAIEELEITRKEMRRVLEWKEYQIDLHKKEITSISANEQQCSSGMCAFIFRRMQRLQKHLFDFVEMFKKFEVVAQ